MRLDQFEALVHHRCRIDTDLCPHRPVGMRDRLRGAHARHIGGAHGTNGPPLAVRMMRRTWSMRPPARPWNLAYCSLSTGRNVAPERSDEPPVGEGCVSVGRTRGGP